MPKYWVKNYFAHGRFPEVGQNQKTEKKVEEKEERLNNGDNIGQATHSARKHAWRMQATWAKQEEKSRGKQWPAVLRPPPRVAHASTPGPKSGYTIVQERNPPLIDRIALFMKI